MVFGQSPKIMPNFRFFIGKINGFFKSIGEINGFLTGPKKTSIFRFIGKINGFLKINYKLV